MAEWEIALLKIAGLFLLMLAGWLARRRDLLGAQTVGTLNRLVADVTLPALIFGQMLASVEPATLRAGWAVPVLAVVTILAALLIGVAAAPLFRVRTSRATFLFLAAMPNWVYLPLPIAEALFGDKGKLVVLLYNVGGMTMLWTVGIWVLNGGRTDRAALRALFLNPGLLATVGGLVLALAVPSLHAAAAGKAPQTFGFALVGVVLQAVAMLGSLTIPLSLLIIGAQLGSLQPHRRAHKAAPGALAGVVVVRLLLAPVAVGALLLLLSQLGWQLDREVRLVVYFTAGMPVAVNCGVLAERFGGDAELASRAIFVTTLLSAITVPALLVAARAAGL